MGKRKIKVAVNLVCPHCSERRRVKAGEGQEAGQGQEGQEGQDQLSKQRKRWAEAQRDKA